MTILVPNLEPRTGVADHFPPSHTPRTGFALSGSCCQSSNYVLDGRRQVLLIEVVDARAVCVPGGQIKHLLKSDPTRRTVDEDFVATLGDSGGWALVLRRIGIDDVIPGGTLQQAPGAINLADTVCRQGPGGL